MTTAKKKPKSITSEELLLPNDEPSLLFALQELIRTNGIDFEQWWDEFKLGFPNGKRSKDTNYQSGLWTKPKYVDITPITSTSGAMTIEYWPDKDKPDNSYLFSGTVSDVIKGIMDVMRATPSTRVNFEVWFEQWKKGFPMFNDNRNGNFQFAGEKQWGRIKNLKARPRYKEWTTPQQREDFGYRVIEYWQDESEEAKSHIFSGSDWQLIQHIIQLEYEGGVQVSSTKQKGGEYPRLKGQPLLRLYFAEDKPRLNKSLRTGEITLRIMNKTDDPKINLDKISKTDIQNYATKIRDLFGSNGGYIWNKGKIVTSYRSRYQGFEGWYLVKNKLDGQNLIAKLLGITDQTFDNTKLFFSENADSLAAYPDAATGSATILGKTVALPEKRPLISVRFQKAEIELALLANPIGLVEGDRVIYNS